MPPLRIFSGAATEFDNNCIGLESGTEPLTVSNRELFTGSHTFLVATEWRVADKTDFVVPAEACLLICVLTDESSDVIVPVPNIKHH